MRPRCAVLKRPPTMTSASLCISLLMKTNHKDFDMNPATESRTAYVAVLLCTLPFAACAPLPSRDAHLEIKPVGRYGTEQSFSAPRGQWPADSWWQRHRVG